VRKLALGIEALAIAVLFGSFLASGGKLLLAGAAVALLVLAGVLGLAGKRREMPGFWLWFVSLLACAFLYIPLVIVVIFSFNDSKLNAEWVGFTTAWYRKLFSDEDMLRAALNSLSIACGAAAIATVLGTMAGLSMHRFKPKLLPFLVFTPVAMPEILLGVSLLIFFLNTVSPALGAMGIDFGLGLTTVVIAHVTFCIGFVAIIVRARLAGMDESIFEAARDLGATPWQTFRLVTLPLIMPGVIAGALMAFTLSIDDFVITFFTSGVGTKTLPLEIYTMIKVAVTPEVNAVSALLMALTLGMIMIAAKLAPDLMRAKT
jgi:spermidine/putrescine transport system permease protein